MSDKMRAQPFGTLLTWILRELEGAGSIFGIPQALFYSPPADAPYGTADLFGQVLAAPVGPAAGPHTQLAQNIVSAWLSGGRFIELKTVQIMDELEIPRPCIDLEDEGYNVEWSQELKLDQSAREYANAWTLIHILHRVLGFRGPVGTVLNMSVGYNLAGIQSPPMLRFMDHLQDASDEIVAIRDTLRSRFAEFADLQIPARITNNVTLSTMHGCPPDEIESIARYLLEERGLHTTVKLNPTLLGKDALMRILHDDLGFREIEIPDTVFEHDLQWGRAVELIKSLQIVAAACGLSFGVKLSNTLAMANHKGYLPGGEMYMSGRPLYPITMNLFHKLTQEFDGRLRVSYSAGADALNVTDILACGALPVTAASDLLKPGGYSRLVQWLENLESEMRGCGAVSLEDLAHDKLANLERVANQALANPRYKKSYFPFGLPKVESRLGLWDCIAAPCAETCAVCQDVPEYAWLIAQGEYERAMGVILQRNPLPGVTGYVCTHLCQTRCTRNNYDEPVAIRDLKRFAFEHGRAQATARQRQQNRRRVAIIGSGPSGLAAAYFLALNGVAVTIFEAREMPGGMLAIAPHFRLPADVVQADIDRIVALGVEIKLNHRVTEPPQELLRQRGQSVAGFDAVYMACGFQKDNPLRVEGEQAEGVLSALEFLEGVARGKTFALGSRVLVVGGGNTAMDAARTARRLTGQPSTVVYRRSHAEMPAETEELRDLVDEGNRLVELATPTRVIVKDGRVAALECIRNELRAAGPDGRRTPAAVEGTEFQIEADSILLAIGQKPDLAFLEGSGIVVRQDGALATDPESRRTSLERVYAGGDVARGPAIIIEACADGRRAAESICHQLGIGFAPPEAQPVALAGGEILGVKAARARRSEKHEPSLLPVSRRGGFDLVEQTLDEEAARAEANRCLQCSTLCDKCVEVCPNRANYAYSLSPLTLMLPVLACENGSLSVVGQEAFAVQQGRQIIHVDDLCNECGNCATFCVHQGKPYADKPRLFLREDDFRAESDNAFYVTHSAGAETTIRRREKESEARLSMLGGGDSEPPACLQFENAFVRLLLSPDMAIREMELRQPFEGAWSLRQAVEMALVLQGILRSLPFLPVSRL